MNEHFSTNWKVCHPDYVRLYGKRDHEVFSGCSYSFRDAVDEALDNYYVCYPGDDEIEFAVWDSFKEELLATTIEDYIDNDDLEDRNEPYIYVQIYVSNEFLANKRGAA